MDKSLVHTLLRTRLRDPYRFQQPVIDADWVNPHCICDYVRLRKETEAYCKGQSSNQAITHINSIDPTTLLDYLWH